MWASCRWVYLNHSADSLSFLKLLGCYFRVCQSLSQLLFWDCADLLLTHFQRYDQTLYEGKFSFNYIYFQATDTILSPLLDSDINRMNEAAGLFESISNSRLVSPVAWDVTLSTSADLLAYHRWFAQSSVVLLMNKIDIFKQKLIASPIYEYYSDYEGPSDFETAAAYMESKFTPLYRNSSIHPLHVHFTCTSSKVVPGDFSAVGLIEFQKLTKFFAPFSPHRCNW